MKINSVKKTASFLILLLLVIIAQVNLFAQKMHSGTAGIETAQKTKLDKQGFNVEANAGTMQKDLNPATDTLVIAQGKNAVFLSSVADTISELTEELEDAYIQNKDFSGYAVTRANLLLAAGNRVEPHTKGFNQPNNAAGPVKLESGSDVEFTS